MTADIKSGSSGVGVGQAGHISSFRPDLQGLRAVAVIAVVLDHLLDWPSGGFVGVDIFFVLSGFFITALLLRELHRTGGLSFKEFYIRRARRILPAALLVLLVTVTAGYIVFPATRAKETLVDTLWAALFAANWRFERVGTDYFQEGLPPSPVQHFWSLSIEEQFYFVWPAVLLGIFVIAAKFGLRRRGVCRRYALIGVVGATVAVSFGWATMQSSTEPTTAYFSTFTRVWELSVGAAVAIAGPALARLPRTFIRPAIAYFGLSGLAASLFLITPDTQFPGPGAVVPVLSTTLVVGAFQGSSVYGMAPLTNKAAQYFGSSSYSLYLWHWPVFVLLAAIMPEQQLSYYVVAVVIALAMSELSFRHFENPIHQSRWLESELDYSTATVVRLRITPKAWSLVGALLAVALVFSLLAIRITDQRAGIGETNEALDTGRSVMEVDPCFGGPAIGSVRCPQLSPSEVTPSIDTFAKDTQGAFSCWRGEGEEIRSCTYGSTQPDALRLALIGDSHAATLLPGLTRRLEENNWSLTTYLGYGCQWQTPAPGDCNDDMQELQSSLLASEPYDAIVTTSGRKYGGPTEAAAEIAYQAAWSAITARGTKIVAVADNPTVSADVIACVTRLGGDPFECGTDRAQALRDEDPLIAAAAKTPGATLVDLTDSYCTADRCPAVVGNVIVYRDTGGHVTATFAETLAPKLVAGIRAALA
ncbi:acyltransferase family protein [Rhodococcus wratislaviensis]|uniref:Putative acetyltransferase n=1 Tax=Rhodococcus wratislaviensis NBRC 100605 TaxID=1219028 RepID=X0Q6T1_RHOWR|nr:acyltransferase family protein [Rhodococcus wratislaviensis]GAF47072.1 putative acetyltransferase [Rhodococcus wratislaviensis NBRC 100605]